MKLVQRMNSAFSEHDTFKSLIEREIQVQLKF